ncbi:MAG: hypothetical protein KME10_12100 [Plectolyngbya sp. WJT66-NPBG17]|jgi:hypothetical protein|nr:hypothetical protein [Plectolyngbya sp. WJT66-NPBG17]
MNTTSTDTQKGQSALVQLNSKGELQWIQVNPNPIKYHAAELWDTLKERETAIVYKQALHKTWLILRQAIALIFFIILLGFALLIVIWGTGFTLGVALQKWIDKQERQPEDFVSTILNALRSPIDRLIQWAKQYVERYLPILKSTNGKSSSSESTDQK